MSEARSPVGSERPRAIYATAHPALSAVLLAFGALAGYLAVGFTVALPTYLVLAGFLVVLTSIDLAEHRLPNRLTARAGMAAVIGLSIASVAPVDGVSLGRAVVAAVLSFVLHLLVHLVSPSGFGMGDVKLAPTIAAHLGFLSWNALGWGVMASFASSAVVVLFLLATKRAGRGTTLAFGPFMAVGAFIGIGAHAVFL